MSISMARERVLRRFYACIDERDWACVLDCVTDDVWWHVPPNDITRTATLAGRSALLGRLDLFKEHHTQHRLRRIVHDHSTSVAFLDIRLAYGRSMMCARATDVIRFRGCRVAEWTRLIAD